MAKEHELKIAAIAGASRALDFKAKNPNATEQEILKHITVNLEEIIQKIDEYED